MEAILIVEDELVIREQLVRLAKEINPELIIYETDSARKALQIASEHLIKAFFVDIQLVDYTGVSLAKQLREMNEYQFVPIVFITGMESMELDAYRDTQCYDFIVKPYTEEKVKQIFIKILVNYMNEISHEEPKLCLEFSGVTQLVPFSDIIYVEYSKYRIIIHTINESIRYQIIPLRKFVKTLPKRFTQIHQNYVVNKEHVISVGLNSMTVILNHLDDPLPIGKGYKHKGEEIINELFR